MKRSSRWFFTMTMLLCASSVLAGAVSAQNQRTPGRSIGTVTSRADLIILELDAGAIAPANLFDLSRRTLRFTPDGSGYRAQNLPIEWDVQGKHTPCRHPHLPGAWQDTSNSRGGAEILPGLTTIKARVQSVT